ncbi:unnamed protein product [Rhizophagus irregularis]|nr:unnamed protein product [Rhizophagus irregularis]
MSSEIKNDYIDWLEKAIAEEYFNYYKYSNFEGRKYIGGESFGNVYCVNMKNTDTIFALKSFNIKFNLKEVVNKIKLHKHVDFHQNILRVYGITRMESDTIHQANEYSLVLEYADSGTLETYLKKHFNELNWDDKYQLALQLASAVECIHNLDIIHHDLHANNVLIHQKNIKLADFGLSRKITKESSNTLLFGVLPYVDPKYFNNKVNDKQNYVLNKRSDVYSIGILMWQISSGHKPFGTYNLLDSDLALAIQNGKRETIIDGTPNEYSRLYKECWKYEENERPSIQDVVSYLKLLNSPKENIIEEENYSITNDQNDIKSGSIKSGEELKKTEEINTSNSSSLGNILELAKAIDCVISFDLEKSEISSSSKNQSSIAYMILGYSKEDFESEKYHDSTHSEIVTVENLLPQYNLALYYEDGIGVNKDEKKSFEIMTQLAEKGYLNAQIVLGNYYSSGIGTEINKVKAFESYKLAAEKGHKEAQYQLGILYEHGDGVEDKAFEIMRQLADKRHPNAQFQLGYYYATGIGTEINKAKAFELHKMAADKGHKDAQYQLGILYEHGEGVDKDVKKAFEIMRHLADEGQTTAQARLGYYYNIGIGTEINKVKAFKSYEIAAEKGHKDAQHELL